MLEHTNLARAKSVVAVSDDEMQNLELGLMAPPGESQLSPNYSHLRSDFPPIQVAQLFPQAQVLCASALSAEAFAGAAFGEMWWVYFASTIRR
jgi:hypothetical protein